MLRKNSSESVYRSVKRSRTDLFRQGRNFDALTINSATCEQPQEIAHERRTAIRVTLWALADYDEHDHLYLHKLARAVEVAF